MEWVAILVPLFFLSSIGMVLCGVSETQAPSDYAMDEPMSHKLPRPVPKPVRRPRPPPIPPSKEKEK